MAAVLEPSSGAGSSTPIFHGLFVLHAKSGALLFSQRFTPAYGLRSAEKLARDELRLSAMLFAIHINAAATSNEENAAGLTVYHIDGVALRFCESPANELLLVLFAPAALGAQE